ncbi:MAG: hypothetical protein J6Y80_00825, partial [Victivallales bacterium]|nr:hypothetical protein [Victivallales bacterium]
MSNHDKYPFDFEPFGRAFAEHCGEPQAVRLAHALRESAKYRPIEWPEGFMLPTVGPVPSNGASFFTSGSGIAYDEKLYARLKQEHPEHQAALAEIRQTVIAASTWKNIRESFSPEEWRLVQSHACWGGTWIGHGTPDYGRLLRLGTNGLRDYLEDCRAKNPGHEDFYLACRLTMDALDILGDRILATARQNSQIAGPRQAEWRRIQNDFRRIPRQGAFDMHSAAMYFWLLFSFNSIDSPERMDQFMYEFYRVSPPEESEEMVTRLLEAMHHVRAWNLCLSGSDAAWHDETNDLSYLILRKVKELRYQTPNLTVRVHRNTPERLWKLSAECLATGNGLPAIYNDEVVCPALEKLGIPPAESHEYCLNGCNQIDIFGKSHMGLEDGEVNLAKVLELTLHEGVDYAATPPEPIAPSFGSPLAATSFAQFLELYFRTLDHIIDFTCGIANRCQEIYARVVPNPLRSCLIQDCLETARDYKNGGPRYGHGQILAEGIADAADSLWAIKTLVFDQQKYSMAELVAALEDDFVGYEALWHDFKKCQKFGNDLPEPDEFCAQIVDHFMQELKKHRTFRGGIYTGGCSPFARAAENGAACAALPNGKRAHEANFADAIGATPGNDTHGPTALLKSLMHYRQTEAGSGFITQLKFAKSLFCNEKGMNAFIALAKAYFDNGGQQLSINVLDRQALLDAR